jgi:hypothetical protein
MHTYRMLVDAAELETHVLPILRANGSEIPPAGCYLAAVEFDEAGDVVAYQLLQNAIFFEGLWARDATAHLLSVWRMAHRYAKEQLKAERVLTMTRSDEQGGRIARIARALGMEPMNWKVFRRRI